MADSKKLAIFLGRAGTGKTSACFEEIRQLIDSDERGDRSIILLVPEPSAYKVERALAASMPQQGFHSVYVVGMQRFMHHLFQEQGITYEDMLSDTGRHLILRALLKRREKELDIFRQVSRQPNFAHIIRGLFKECHAFGITPDAMEAALERMKRHDKGHGILLRKWKDLSLIAKDYEDYLQEHIGTTLEPMDILIDIIPQSAITKEAYVFIDGFHWFTPQQMRLMEALIGASTKTVITITAPTIEQGLRQYERPGTLFYRTWETYTAFERLYASQMEVRNFHENKRHSKSLKALERGFFTSPVELRSDDARLEIPLYGAYNPKREVDFICRNILKRMEEDPKRRYKDFAIMLRKMDHYRDLLEKALQHYEIPYFVDQANPMVTHPLAECIESFFALAARPYHHATLFRLLKTDLLPFTREEVDRLENYCIQFGIKESHWQQEEPWTYVTYDTEEEAAKAEAMTACRDKMKSLVEPFLTFAKKDAHRGRQWAEALYEVLNLLQVDVQLNQWYEEALAREALVEGKGHLQVYKRLMSLLEEIHIACGDEVLTLAEVAMVCKEGLSEITYSLVPPSLDHVIVTSIERSYANDYPIVYVPGLNDGIFPQRMGDEGILRDAERDLLRKFQVELAAGALVQAFHENFLFYLACTRPREALILSYANSTTDGEPLEAALIVRRMVKSGYCTEPMPITRDILFGTEDEYIWRPRQSLSLLATQMSPITKGERIPSIWWNLYKWGQGEKPLLIKQALRGMEDTNEATPIAGELLKALLMPKEYLSGSVTRLERYNSCPFAFFAQYVLQANPRPEKTYAAPEMGTYLHENLRRIGEYLLSHKQAWRDLSDEAITILMEQFIEETASTLNHGFLQEEAYTLHIKDRLTAILRKTIERLRTWSEGSRFDMYSLEQSFGQPAESPFSHYWRPVEIALPSGTKIRLRGQIDRLDLWQPSDEVTYGMIIDYKSGAQSLSAQDVYYGLKLQLLTYLLALETNLRDKQGQPVLPAALLYTYVQNPQLSIKYPLTEADAQKALEKDFSLRNKGYVMPRLSVLEGIYKDYENTNLFIPLKFTKSGDIHGSYKKHAKTTFDFYALLSYTKSKIKETAIQISEGSFPIEPYVLKGKTPCTYCDYASLCRFDPLYGDDVYRHLWPLEEEVAMEHIYETCNKIVSIEKEAEDIRADQELLAQLDKKGDA